MCGARKEVRISPRARACLQTIRHRETRPACRGDPASTPLGTLGSACGVRQTLSLFAGPIFSREWSAGERRPYIQTLDHGLDHVHGLGEQRLLDATLLESNNDSRLRFLPLLAIGGLVLVAGCKPSWIAGNPASESAPWGLTDQAVLASRRRGQDADVRRAAVQKLTDQAVLAKVAVEAL